MNVIFVRHGEAWNNLPNAREIIAERGPDAELTEKGRAQAARVGDALAGVRAVGPASQWQPEGRIEAVFSSLMLRAVQTGAAVSEACGVPHIGVPMLHECGGVAIGFDPAQYGRVFAGAMVDVLRSHAPSIELPNDLPSAGWWGRGYEVPADWPSRGRRIIDWLRGISGYDTVCVITHGDIFSILMRELIACGRTSTYPLVNTGRTRVHITEEAVSLVYHNRFDHLVDGLAPSL